MVKRKRKSESSKSASTASVVGLPQVHLFFLAFTCIDSLNPPSSQKKHYRQRAHANPFSDHALDYPAAPQAVSWDSHYPAFVGTGKAPEFADIGCGFGGLLIALAPLFPETLMLGQYRHPHHNIPEPSLTLRLTMTHQEWKSASRYHSTLRTALPHFG
jgi:hypothetical protein